MKLAGILIIFGMLFYTASSFSQMQLNQTDTQGKPHGLWKKYYDNSKQLRYEGRFEDGKEVGEFKFYCEDCKENPVAIKIFNENNDIAEVKYFTKGKIVSEGKMDGKDRIGEWITYHKDGKTPMVRETFKEGKLDGKKIIYYPNGQVTEEQTFKMGVKEGENLFYSPDGIVIKKLFYKDNMLDGKVFYYDGYGNLVIEGGYKADAKNGLWKYYKDGKEVMEESFPKKNRE